MIRPALADDADAMARIYNHYVRHTVVSFEEQALAPSAMAGRLREVQAAALPWLVVEDEDGVLGYACAGRWKARSAYRFSVETSVYVDPDRQRQGLGRALYRGLFDALREAGAHAVIGGIALPNEASVGLHEAFGMRKVAHFAEVGYKFGRWIDFGYWQTTLA